MLQKRNLTQKLEKIDQILEPFGLAQSVQSKKEELFTEIRNYRFRVLLVGGFSSGKSIANEICYSYRYGFSCRIYFSSLCGALFFTQGRTLRLDYLFLI